MTGRKTRGRVNLAQIIIASVATLAGLANVTSGILTGTLWTPSARGFEMVPIERSADAFSYYVAWVAAVGLPAYFWIDIWRRLRRAG